jgi:hypothetical protein
MPAALALPCSRCGVLHAQEIGYALPDAALAIPHEEREARFVGDKDHLAVDGRLFFLRAWAPVPLLFVFPRELLPAHEPAAIMRIEDGKESPFGIGFWIQVGAAAHRDYVECEAAFLARHPRPHAEYEGRIANQFDLLGHSLGTAVRASFRQATYNPLDTREYLLPPRDRTNVLWGTRPALHALDPDSWLGRLQRTGLSAQTHAAWMERCAHPDEPEPIGAPFTADLEQHGWEILTAADLGKAPHPFATPPAAGELVKLAIRFLSADPEGDVYARNAGWWLRVDDARSGPLWTGHLFSVPPAGAPIANGARIWLRPDQVLGHQLHEA